MLLVGLVLLWLNQRHRARTGSGLHSVRLIALFLLVPPLIVAWLTGFPLSWDVPHLAGFNFTGGMTVIPEFVAMALALSLYGASYIAEIVRSGISAVPAGQIDAARALGLSRGAINRFIVIPQALRVILPPLGTQYIVLLKNTSLAAAIAYPDLMLVFGGTVLNQTGQPLEVMIITMASYVLIGLAIGARDQPAQPPRPAGGAVMGKLRAFLRSCVATPFNAVLSIRHAAARRLAARRPFVVGGLSTRCGAEIPRAPARGTTRPAGCSSDCASSNCSTAPTRPRSAGASPSWRCFRCSPSGSC